MSDSTGKESQQLSTAEKLRRRREARHRRILDAGNDRLSKITQLMQSSSAASSTASHDSDLAAPSPELSKSLSAQDVNPPTQRDETSKRLGFEQSEQQGQSDDGITTLEGGKAIETSENENVDNKVEPTFLHRRNLVPDSSTASSLRIQSPSTSFTTANAPVRSPSVARTPVTAPNSSSLASRKKKKTTGKARAPPTEALPLQMQSVLYANALRKWSLIHLVVMTFYSMAMFYWIWDKSTELHVDGFGTLARLMTEESEEVRVPILNVFQYFLVIELILQSTRILFDKTTLRPPSLPIPSIRRGSVFYSFAQFLEAHSFTFSQIFSDTSILLVVFGLGVIGCKIMDDRF